MFIPYIMLRILLGLANFSAVLNGKFSARNQEQDNDFCV